MPVEFQEFLQVHVGHETILDAIIIGNVIELGRMKGQFLDDSHLFEIQLGEILESQSHVTPRIGTFVLVSV